MSEPDVFNLQRFITAQNGVYEKALAEIQAGHKRCHWMWFIFPQLRGLGASSTSAHYGLTSLAEARAFLGHPKLGKRLLHCVKALQSSEKISAETIFGKVDALKLRSCMTLFAMADPNSLMFREIIERWFGGRPDELTMRLLGVDPETGKAFAWRA